MQKDSFSLKGLHFMIKDELCRFSLLVGEEAIEKLSQSHVAVFGVGGVGGYVCEALARSGVGHIALFDNDTVSRSNINRQIVALNSTVGERKTTAMRNRLIDINPTLDVTEHPVFYSPDNANEFDLSKYDYIADAIDSVKSKTELIVRAHMSGVPIISAMGTGNKLDPSRLMITDLSKTSNCPLAKVMRHELKKRNIVHSKVVFSTEEAIKSIAENSVSGEKRHVPGSSAFVPPTAGLMMAAEIVKYLISK